MAMAGGVVPLQGNDLKKAEEGLQNSLTKLAAGDGPNFKIYKVHTASTQVVAGTLTKLNVDLIGNDNVIKNYNVSIWSQPWLKNGIEVTFECDNEEKVVKRHDP